MGSVVKRNFGFLLRRLNAMSLQTKFHRLHRGHRYTFIFARSYVNARSTTENPRTHQAGTAGRPRLLQAKSIAPIPESTHKGRHNMVPCSTEAGLYWNR